MSLTFYLVVGASLILPTGVRAADPTGDNAPAALGTRSATFRIHHALTVKDIPTGSETVRVWFWLPDDDENQKVLDLSVSKAPPGYKITREAAYGNRYLYAEVDHPQSSSLTITTDFLIRRDAVSVALDPEKAGPLSDAHRTLFAEFLRRNVPGMEVNEQIIKLAGEICGNETNEVRQIRLLSDWVVKNTDHYSRPNAPKSSGKGSATYCLAMKGGGCTDQHALFIALARALGIPTRLQFGSLLRAKNEGKDMDPGYRCWVQFFVPNYGWVAADLSAANTNPLQREFYFSGLDEHRVRFMEGRDLELSPPQAGPRLNLMIVAYVEVDGKPYPAFSRTLKFTEVRPMEEKAAPVKD